MEFNIGDKIFVVLPINCFHCNKNIYVIAMRIIEDKISCGDRIWEYRSSNPDWIGFSNNDNIFDDYHDALAFCLKLNSEKQQIKVPEVPKEVSEVPKEVQEFFDEYHNLGEYDQAVKLEFEDGSLMFLNHAITSVIGHPGSDDECVAIKTEHMGNHYFDNRSGLICVEEQKHRFSPIVFTRAV